MKKNRMVQPKIEGPTIHRTTIEYTTAEAKTQLVWAGSGITEQQAPILAFLGIWILKVSYLSPFLLTMRITQLSSWRLRVGGWEWGRWKYRRLGGVPLPPPLNSTVTMKCISARRDLFGIIAYIIWQIFTLQMPNNRAPMHMWIENCSNWLNLKKSALSMINKWSYFFYTHTRHFSTCISDKLGSIVAKLSG